MKKIIVARDTPHLQSLIKDADRHAEYDLNHIDVSGITDMSNLFMDVDFTPDISGWDTRNVIDMSYMFFCSSFDGDISQWNTSNVKNMHRMFSCSQFNGDISRWETSNVKDMGHMFSHSQFNGNIGWWDVRSVENMHMMFTGSQFTGDTSRWMPISLNSGMDVFDDGRAPQPYWFQYDDMLQRNNAILLYHLYDDLNNELENRKNNKKVKL